MPGCAVVQQFKCESGGGILVFVVFSHHIMFPKSETFNSIIRFIPPTTFLNENNMYTCSAFSKYWNI